MKVLIITSLCLLGPVSGCRSSHIDQKIQSTSVAIENKQPLRVELRLIDESVIVLTVTNDTLESTVFCPRQDFVEIYHEASDEKKTLISFDASKADMPAVNAFDTVLLPPKSSFVTEMDEYVSRRAFLEKPGVVYAVVKPLPLFAIESRYVEVARSKPLLNHEIVSNRIIVPIKLQRAEG